ncbi:TetR/AcrR family transcriptional regulator [Bradyrhizobium sp. 2]|uniref:TetR/AcrR family transcriptional regulator n=1 Tax=unclassified Bradyrhizobium TaxID=2631580 RepID=UPI001FFA2C59|nr:TetR/AcrR family transcriptional regulator [Bradyrhizobium sp. 2]MCK1462960.1 TetR/AcrR family transcriptional regulator [Bradyrhizobium sp. 2]
MKQKSTRQNIIEAADGLFYRKGFEHTSFSDIADAVSISRGNFYFYFKTKDDLLGAVIDRRIAETGRMLERWEAEGQGPSARIRSFIDMLIANRADIKRYGCPVGTLCSELAKLDHAAQPEATQLFTLFREWLRRQFEVLGHAAQADTLAMHLLGRSQGVTTLAHAFHDERFVRNEVEAMSAWLTDLKTAAMEPGRQHVPRRRRATHHS